MKKVTKPTGNPVVHSGVKPNGRPTVSRSKNMRPMKKGCRGCK